MHILRLNIRQPVTIECQSRALQSLITILLIPAVILLLRKVTKSPLNIS